MHPVRFSLASLIGAVSFLALLLAAWRSESQWLTSVAYSLVMLALLVSATAVILRRGRTSPFLIGFAVFGWGYWLGVFRGGPGEFISAKLYMALVEGEEVATAGRFVIIFGMSTRLAIWHSGCIVVLALVGGCIARFLDRRMKRAGTEPQGPLQKQETNVLQ